MQIIIQENVTKVKNIEVIKSYKLGEITWKSEVLICIPVYIQYLVNIFAGDCRGTVLVELTKKEGCGLGLVVSGNLFTVLVIRLIFIPHTLTGSLPGMPKYCKW